MNDYESRAETDDPYDAYVTFMTTAYKGKDISHVLLTRQEFLSHTNAQLRADYERGYAAVFAEMKEKIAKVVEEYKS
jgi:hypothetical protein